MADCLFCKIINREIPASIVYEDDRVLAFNDINPQAPTHVLVVPKRHIASLNDLTPDDDQIVGELVQAGGGDRDGARHLGRRLPDGVQHEPRRRPDRLPHPPAPDRRPQPRLAAGLEPVESCRRARRARVSGGPGSRCYWSNARTASLRPLLTL